MVCGIGGETNLISTISHCYIQLYRVKPVSKQAEITKTMNEKSNFLFFIIAIAVDHSPQAHKCVSACLFNLSGRKAVNILQNNIWKINVIL